MSTSVTPARIVFGGLATTLIALIAFQGVASTVLGLAGMAAMVIGAFMFVSTFSQTRSSHTSSPGAVPRPPMWRVVEDEGPIPPESDSASQAERPVHETPPAQQTAEPQAFAWVAPPTWPQPPAGWTPPQDWVPDPAWGPAPPGWQFWQPARATGYGYQRQGPGTTTQTPTQAWQPDTGQKRTSEDRKWLIWAAVGVVILLFAAPWRDGPDYEVDDDEALQTLDAAMREANGDAPWLETLKRVRMGLGENIDVYTTLDGQSAGSAATAVEICEAYTAASPVPGPRVMVWGEKPSIEVDGSDSRGRTKLASSGGNALASAPVDDCSEITDLTDPDRSGG